MILKNSPILRTLYIYEILNFTFVILSVFVSFIILNNLFSIDMQVSSLQKDNNAKKVSSKPVSSKER